MNSPQREIRRVRHEVKRRRLTVDKITGITPKMLRITLTGAELAGFTSLGFDDHVKLFFPTESTSEPEPTDGPPMRDYTPRYDAGAGVLHIDFAIHDAGPATDWALRARVGDSLTIGGPRGSAIIPMEFDWYLFIGDETALPAIGRRLEELPAGSRPPVRARDCWRRCAPPSFCPETTLPGRRRNRMSRGRCAAHCSMSAAPIAPGSRPRAIGSAARLPYMRTSRIEGVSPHQSRVVNWR